ncbi:MAG: hypothetical protein ACI4IS_02945 [Acutalibacteraceae bacterium]
MALISLPEWAKKNGIAPASARQKVLRGYLPAVKIGRNWLIDEDQPNVDNRKKDNKTVQGDLNV